MLESSPDELVFLGGFAGEYATELRIAGFHDALRAHRITPAPDAVAYCGYRPSAARLALTRRYDGYGRLPAGLFINSITALEGLVQFASQLPWKALRSVVVGCFDWDPFAAHLPFTMTMMRQNVEKIISDAFSLIDSYDPDHHPLVVVPTGFGGLLDEDEPMGCVAPST